MAQRTVQTTLYSGIGLIIVSMLFLFRDIQTTSFITQAAAMLAAPLFFYGVGWLVYRHLDAPLAAPGIVATGAWLLVVALVHLWAQQALLPETIQGYYWSVASVIVAMIVTPTGHRARLWLLVPLVPVVQINALWAVTGVLRIAPAWVPMLTFGLVLLWCEAEWDDAWGIVYKISAALLTLFLLVASFYLTDANTNSILATWGAGSLVVAYLGLRNGWTRAGPLAIVMLVCATAWGLSPEWWPVTWLGLATLTIVFIEYNADTAAAEASTALAVVLVGVAAVFTQLAFLWDVTLPAGYSMTMLLEAGLLLAWLGWRRGIIVAAHVGVWLVAAAWSEFYFMAVGDYELYGLWLSLMAALALAFERLMTSFQGKEKHKKHRSVQETVMRWPLADLTIGLTAIVVIWMFLNLQFVLPFIIAVTMAVVVGTWIVAGLVYRLAEMLHVALWIAPIPYMLLVMQFIPAFRDLELIALAWQCLALGFLALGHLLTQHRPSMRLPFFIAGYTILALSVTLVSGMLFAFSLGLVVIVFLLTSVVVIADYHPTWTYVVDRALSRYEHPYAYQNIHNFFLILGTWLTVVWLRVMLDYTTLTLAQQGVFLVVMSAAWVTLGRLLPRIPGVVGWPVYGAGWLMWLLGLIQVFHAPTEALITLVLGLAISIEALTRTRAVAWMPVLVLQILFAAVQIIWRLEPSGSVSSISLLLAVMSIVTVAGVMRGGSGGQLTAVSAGLLAAGLWLVELTPLNSGLMTLPLLVALYRYRQVFWIYPLYGIWITQAILSDPYLAELWPTILITGLVQMGIGVVLAVRLRAQGYQSIIGLLNAAHDWASPFLWFGFAMTSIGALTGLFLNETAPVLWTLLVAAVLMALYTHKHGAPYAVFVLAFLLLMAQFLASITPGSPLIGDTRFGTAMLTFANVWAVLAVTTQILALNARRVPRRFIWWIKPAVKFGHALMLVSPGVVLGGISPYVGGVTLLVVVYCALLTAYFGLMAYRLHRLDLAYWTLAAAFSTWAALLHTTGLFNTLTLTIPAGLVLMLIAAIYNQGPLVELSGVGLFLAGGAIGVAEQGILSPYGVILTVQLALLAAYGLWVGRRVPVVCTALVVIGGFTLRIVLMNFWLAPLLTGVALLSGALLMEVEREKVAHWKATWLHRWQQWR